MNGVQKVKNYIYVNIFSFKLDFWISASIFRIKTNFKQKTNHGRKSRNPKKADNKVANDKNLNLAISGINKQFGQVP